jgi:MoaA/NifB/PqqE/SkfB family radical SAM enzyme/predicted phosphodiesterase
MNQAPSIAFRISPRAGAPILLIDRFPSQHAAQVTKALVVDPGEWLLVFGGPYSNLEALQAMIAEVKRRSIPPERVICTGDVVAYGADASATAGLIRDFGCHVIMGNCEESLAASLEDCGCGFRDGSACQRLAADWFSHARAEMTPELRSWMSTLSRRIHVELGNMRLAVVHGSSRSINRFVFASTPAAEKAEELDHAGVDGVIAGHCGIPFTQIIGGRLWHNAGAIGMPANDGTPRVWYSVLCARDGVISVDHCALQYDHETAAQKMRRAGLPEGYAAALKSGLWPSCDVLPVDEMRERGTAITEGSAEWRQNRATARKVKLDHLWPSNDRGPLPSLLEEKFRDPERTAAGAPRAHVELERLHTLWINTGTLCNITCRNCYIESSPKNDRLVYVRKSEVVSFLDEILDAGLPTEDIGLTGGEPFMNPEIIDIVEECLGRGFKVLILTNAMRPMQRHKSALLQLNRRYGSRLTLRISLDHYTAEQHEAERGPGTFAITLSGLKWLSENGFHTTLAGRTMWREDQSAERDGYARLLRDNGIMNIRTAPDALVLFPEMEAGKDTPEITTACWDILHKSPRDVMCSSSRMIVKRKGEERAVVVACTLLPYDKRFELGYTLTDARTSVALNHPFCSQFCVLGGASCSGR